MTAANAVLDEVKTGSVAAPPVSPSIELSIPPLRHRSNDRTGGCQTQTRIRVPAGVA